MDLALAFAHALLRPGDLLGCRAALGWRVCAAGIATQVGAVVGYYAYAEFFRDGMGA